MWGHGIGWGGYESWHPDQMAFRDLSHDDRPLNPDHFLRPPLYSYVVAAVLTPTDAALEQVGASQSTTLRVRLLVARTVTGACFLLCVLLVFRIVGRLFGPTAAGLVALQCATTAGFVAYAHFLTVDVAVSCLVLLAVDAAQLSLASNATRYAAVAGLATGLATATKYNGLSAGIALAAAWWLSADRFRGSGLRRFALGLGFVVAGFLAANPYAVLDAGRFAEDFIYVSLVTPVLSGDLEGTSYARFLWAVVQVVGWPQALMIAAAAILTVRRLGLRPGSPLVHRQLAIVAAVGLVYLLTFGAFPRLPVRFVLPVVPLALLLCGAVWRHLATSRLALAGLAIALVGHSLLCAVLVGARLRQDPRSSAQRWLVENLPAGAAVEFTPYSPEPGRLPGVDSRARKMPFASGRRDHLERLLSSRPWLRRALDRHEPPIETSFYTRGALEQRAPDFLVLDSLYFDRFVTDGDARRRPGPGVFFSSLLEERWDYRLVFERETLQPPFWVYPPKIDFLANRVVILRHQRTAE